MNTNYENIPIFLSSNSNSSNGEIDYDKISSIRGMDIIIHTSAKNDEQAKELLKGFNFPFYN